MSKLIILRGNSGSGKSSAANKIAKNIKTKLALIDADKYRVDMLFPKPYDKADHAALMKHNVLYCLDHGYDVIWDSIFYASERNRIYLGEILDVLHPIENFIFNFDVSLEETKIRHASRTKSRDFTFDQMLEWYQPVERFGYEYEYTIPESNTLKQTVDRIIHTCNLK